MIKIDLKPTVPQLKSFGFIALFGFSLMATMVMWNFTGWQLHWSVYLLFGLAALCPLLSLIAPAANRPVYVTLMILALPIGFVLSNVVLRLIYYGMFTPIQVAAIAALEGPQECVAGIRETYRVRRDVLCEFGRR